MVSLVENDCQSGFYFVKDLTMSNRQQISKKTRFEVFKRDKFKCQYCGRMSPDVILEVDHIKPVAEGGTNDLLNLITSCRDCNRGKGKTRISDESELKKQQIQIQELAERREQIEFMAEFRKDLVAFYKEQAEWISDYIRECSDGKYTLNENGLRIADKLRRQFTLDEIYTAIDIAFMQYYDGTPQSIEKIVNKIGGICYNRRKDNGTL